MVVVHQAAEATTPFNRISRAYAPDALRDGVIDANDDDATLGDCHLLHDTGRASNSGMSVTAQRLSDTKVEVALNGAVGNPLVFSAPTTDWLLKVVIDEAASTWTLTGDHDGFPAYEVYINSQPMYTFSPGSPPYSFVKDVSKLFPPMEVSVNRSGPLLK
jgi:hypothetical protein